MLKAKLMLKLASATPNLCDSDSAALSGPSQRHGAFVQFSEGFSEQDALLGLVEIVFEIPVIGV